MLVLATNRAEDLDDAVLDRMVYTHNLYMMRYDMMCTNTYAYSCSIT
jgi:hypothetical protein